MLVLLSVLILIGGALELYSILDGVKHISFESKAETEQAEQGEPIKVIARAANTGRMPVSYLCATVAYPAAAIFPEEIKIEKRQFVQNTDIIFKLKGRQQVTKSVNVYFQKRGVHFFKGAVLQRGDYLGFYQGSVPVELQQRILIYPKKMENEDMLCKMGTFCGDMIARRHLLQDPILTMGIREYTGREPMKTISWTQSARRGQLMVREFDYTRDLSCTVLFSVDGMDPTLADSMDKCCSIVRTVCSELTARNINVDFYTNGSLWGIKNRESNIWGCTATQGYDGELLRALALLLPSPARCSANHLAVNAVRASGHHTAYVVVAPARTTAVLQMLDVLKEASVMDVLLVTAEDYPDEAEVSS